MRYLLAGTNSSICRAVRRSSSSKRRQPSSIAQSCALKLSSSSLPLPSLPLLLSLPSFPSLPSLPPFASLASRSPAHAETPLPRPTPRRRGPPPPWSYREDQPPGAVDGGAACRPELLPRRVQPEPAGEWREDAVDQLKDLDERCLVGR